MFGTNEIHGRKTFADRQDFLVTSIFHTLQGEGPFAGRPATFLRLAHCNLACTFCDTNFSHGDWMSPTKVMDTIFDMHATRELRDIILVITGGEPTLQREALGRLFVSAPSFFDKVQIESNGVLPMSMPDSIYYLISPKCNERGAVRTPSHYIKPSKEVLARANCMKFVLTADKTSPYHEVPPWAREWRVQTHRPIYISPMAEYNVAHRLVATRPDAEPGSLVDRSAAERVSFWEPGLLDMAKVRANHEYAAAYCVQHGFYLSMQMQLFTSLA
jgi:7-carboxy-7-deazaguanine synthase